MVRYRENVFSDVRQHVYRLRVEEQTMPPKSEFPLRRVTLNLFEADCEAMERRYGRGWTERVRDMVADHIRRYAVELTTEEQL